MVSARTLFGVSAAVLVFSTGSVMAQDLVYQPTIPGFGGNPDNWGYLLGTAQIQNQHVPQGGGGGGGGAPDITFPPIVIDLGGIGNPIPAPAPATPVAGGSGTN